MVKFKYTVAFSILIALGLSFMNNRGDAMGSLFFHLGLDAKKDKTAIEASIRDYNTYSAGFYSSGGYYAGLKYVPAAQLLKRRLVKDINLLGRNGIILVFDLDSQHMKRIYFIGRDLAVAETKEVWAVAFQDAKTRKPLSTVKASVVNVRYRLVKRKGKWMVDEADVYPKGEDIPPAELRPVL